MADSFEVLSPSDLAAEYEALLEFVHLAPIGLVRSNRAGEVSMMNPMAMQLLAPLGIGASGALNIFELLDQASKDIRVLAQELKPCVGVICENYTVELPRDVKEPDRPGVTTALLVSVMQLPQTSAGDLMFVIQDGSATLKMQRMRSTWYR